MFYPLKAEIPSSDTFAPIMKESGLLKNPDNEVAHAAAFRIIFIYTISSSFDLNEEETIWVGYQLDSILSPLLRYKPNTVPFPVRQEMLKKTYSYLLEQKSRVDKKTITSQKFSNNVLIAELADWVDALMNILTMSYNLKPVDEIKIRGELSVLLSSLGVGALISPRMASHLPNDILTNIFKDKLSN